MGFPVSLYGGGSRLFRGFLEVLICKVKGKRREGAAREDLEGFGERAPTLRVVSRLLLGEAEGSEVNSCETTLLALPCELGGACWDARASSARFSTVTKNLRK